MSRVRHESHDVTMWQIAACAPGAIDDPASPNLAWSEPIEGPASTAAALLRRANAWSLDADARRFDAEDWWFRATLPAMDGGVLCLDGIATVADVWVDGLLVATTESMFRAYELPLPRGGGVLVIRCKALDALLGAKRPRPRWKVPMIENQQLRWQRTTLLGRTPGWSPPVAAVGPWRGVRVERRSTLPDVRLATRIESGTGIVEARGVIEGTLVVERDAWSARAAFADGVATLAIEAVHRWWPHTHGEPCLYHARIETAGGSFDVGRIGFREVVKSGDFALAVNEVPVFCRGACWTPLDVVALAASPEAYRRALLQARDAGMNMIRVGGTMVYEADAFYDLCDELGILLWHDFMFANMDYPEDDAAFVANVEAETRQFLARMQGRPSLAVLCGNSEGEQQAAMFGAPRERWSPKLFHDVLAAIAHEERPDVPYWPSSAHGGAFPHEPRVGTTSYYGVGAYLRPLEDARRSEVRFATECLAFANVPEKTAPSTKVHHPAWKARTPRDLGAGWDFDDVRDHYVELLFGHDPTKLRYADHDRYLDLGRAATGEAMAAAFGEWRRHDSKCGGALVWFSRDLWAGAGWGVVDAEGTPKAAYWYLRRACAPVAVHLSDEGNNGMYVHVANDGPAAMEGALEIGLFRSGEVSTGKASKSVRIEPHASLSFAALEAFDGFLDVSNAYRFGPPLCDLVVATLRVDGTVAAEAFHFPLGRPSGKELDLGLGASARANGDGTFSVTIRTRRFAQAVSVEADGFAADDAWFHLAPGAEKTLLLRRVAGEKPFKGNVRALNFDGSTKIVLEG